MHLECACRIWLISQDSLKGLVKQWVGLWCTIVLDLDTLKILEITQIRESLEYFKCDGKT